MNMNELLIINYDNKQIINLITNENIKLYTRFRYINIYSYYRDAHSVESSSQTSQPINTPREQTPHGTQAAAWQSTFQSKASGPPAKRAYTQVKIRQRRNVTVDEEL